MKKLLSVMVVALIISFSAVSASALNFPYFAQDDFTLTFGTPGNAGSAGSKFVSDGTVAGIAGWSDVNVLSFFKVEGTNTTSAAVVGTQYKTIYDVSTLSVYSNAALTNLIWAGSGSLTTLVNMDGSRFPAPARPSYVSVPVSYESMGFASFTQTFGVGEWATYPELLIPWLGSYNWRYLTVDGVQVAQLGNLQGELTVPEPFSLLLLGMGLLGVGFLRRKE